MKFNNKLLIILHNGFNNELDTSLEDIITIKLHNITYPDLIGNLNDEFDWNTTDFKI